MESSQLSNLGLQNLTIKECKKIDGGNFIRWRLIIKWGKRLLEAAGAYEAYKDVREGYNSCRK